MNTNIIKFALILLTLYFSEDSAEQQDSDTAHPGVVCDGCEKHIFGIRFKCVVCPDFDLCMTCETKGMHKEHEMLRIATPRTPGDNWFPGFNPFGFGHPPCHPPHGHPPHHPPHGHPPHHPPHGPPPPHGIPPYQFDFGRGFGPWGRGFGRRGGRGRCGKARGRCNSGGKKCDRHTEANTGEVPVGPPFLHAVGETIASFLGPLGVEVHTYASTEEGMHLQKPCTSTGLLDFISIEHVLILARGCYNS